MSNPAANKDALLSLASEVQAAFDVAGHVTPIPSLASGMHCKRGRNFLRTPVHLLNKKRFQFRKKSQNRLVYHSPNPNQVKIHIKHRFSMSKNQQRQSKKFLYR